MDSPTSQRPSQQGGYSRLSRGSLSGRSWHYSRQRYGTLLQDEITEVNSELATARKQRAEAEAALNDAKAAHVNHEDENLGPVLGSQLIEKLREQEALTAARLADMSSWYGPGSPTLKALNDQLAKIEQTIQSEITRITASLSNRVSIAKAYENTLTARLKALTVRIAQMDKDNVPLQSLERQATVERDLYTNFMNRFKETDPWLEYPAARVRILSAATVPVHASFPNMTIALPFALVLSLALAVRCVLILESRRGGVVSMSDVDRLLGVTSLGLLPLSRRPSALRNPIFREAVSVLFVRTMHQTEKGPPKSVLIASAVSDEGKSTTALAFARDGAARGLSVLLIDGDLRSRSLSATISGEIDTTGFAEVLRGEVSPERAARYVPGMGLSFLSAGRTTGSPGHLLGLPSLEATMRAFEGQFDLVVVDLPPVLAGVDAWLLGRSTSTTVLLARWRRTSIERIALAIKMLAMSQSKLAGIALSRVNVRENSQYDHGDAVLFSPAMRRYYGNGPTAISFHAREVGQST